MLKLKIHLSEALTAILYQLLNPEMWDIVRAA